MGWERGGLTPAAAMSSCRLVFIYVFVSEEMRTTVGGSKLTMQDEGVSSTCASQSPCNGRPLVCACVVYALLAGRARHKSLTVYQSTPIIIWSVL